MMPSSSICTVANAQHPRRLSAGSAQARIGALDSTSRRATNPVARRPDRSFTPTHTTMLRASRIAATASVQAPHAKLRG